MTEITPEHVHQSNLIEGFDDPSMDACGVAAWTWLRGVERLTVSDLTFLHRVVVARQRDPAWALSTAWRGYFRQVDLEVGGRTCPPHREVPLLIRGWLDEMRGWSALDPREMHVEYEKIHPWADGNGRTGRLLMWWHEVNRGREPTLIRYGNREAYYDWFPDE